MVHHTNWYGHSSLSNHVPEHGAVIGASCVLSLHLLVKSVFPHQSSLSYFTEFWKCELPSMPYYFWKCIFTHTGACIEIL